MQNWYNMQFDGPPSGDDKDFDIYHFYQERLKPTICGTRDLEDTLLKTLRFAQEDVRESMMAYMNRCNDQIALLLELVAGAVFGKPVLIERMVGSEALNRIREMSDYEEVIDYLVGLLDPED